MRPERIRLTGFIRGHCGSVTTEAPQDRANGAQRHSEHVSSVHLQGKRVCFAPNHPAGEALPTGLCLLREFSP